MYRFSDRNWPLRAERMLISNAPRNAPHWWGCSQGGFNRSTRHYCGVGVPDLDLHHSGGSLGEIERIVGATMPRIRRFLHASVGIRPLSRTREMTTSPQLGAKNCSLESPPVFRRGDPRPRLHVRLPATADVSLTGDAGGCSCVCPGSAAPKCRSCVPADSADRNHGQVP